MKKSTAITIVVVLSALLVFSFVPRMVQYFAPESETSDTVTDPGSDITSEPLSELELGHTYEFTVPTGDEADILQALIVTEGNFWYVEFEEGNYIGVNGGTISNTANYLLYTNADISLLNDDYSDGPVYGTKEFTITHDATIHSNNIDLLPYLTDITEEQPLFTRVEAERYELQFPDEVNGQLPYGGLVFGASDYSDTELIFPVISLDDADCIDNEMFFLSIYLYIDGPSMTENTLLLHVEQGEYGRYVISETQVADEPVSYTLEPIYEYVLVE